MILDKLHVSYWNYTVKRSRAPKVTHGLTGFMCCFKSDYFLFGLNGSLYIVYNSYDDLMTRDPNAWYKEDWPHRVGESKENWRLKLEFSHSFRNPRDSSYTLAVREELLYIQSISVSERFGIQNAMRYVHFGQPVEATATLITLQRWLRAVILRWKERQQTVAMCLHARLGVKSGLGELGSDMLSLVMRS